EFLKCLTVARRKTKGNEWVDIQGSDLAADLDAANTLKGLLEWTAANVERLSAKTDLAEVEKGLYVNFIADVKTACRFIAARIMWSAGKELLGESQKGILNHLNLRETRSLEKHNSECYAHGEQGQTHLFFDHAYAGFHFAESWEVFLLGR